MRQQGVITLGNVCLLMTLVSSLYLVWHYGPHYLVKHRMDSIAIETLDVWKETGSQDKARDFLRYQMKKKRIPPYLKRHLCELRKQGLQRHVTCGWDVLVEERILEQTLLEFRVHKYLNADGLLEDVE